MPEAIYIRIGDAIRRKRESRGMTQAVLAEKVALARTSITNIEAGSQAIPLHQFLNISQALGVNPADLLPISTKAGTEITVVSPTPEFETLLEKLVPNQKDTGS